MGVYLNPGNDKFRRIINSEIYIDKTGLILYTNKVLDTQQQNICVSRPRRFGKTLNMSMLNCFFSNKYMNRADLFEKFEIWTDEKYRKLQGTYPVINLSFADVKDDNFKNAKN